jgi:hypothetical protein
VDADSPELANGHQSEVIFQRIGCSSPRGTPGNTRKPRAIRVVVCTNVTEQKVIGRGIQDHTYNGAITSKATHHQFK